MARGGGSGGGFRHSHGRRKQSATGLHRTGLHRIKPGCQPHHLRQQLLQQRIRWVPPTPPAERYDLVS